MPLGGVPLAVAVSVMVPFAMSSTDTVYVAVQFSWSPGANVVLGHEMDDNDES